MKGMFQKITGIAGVIVVLGVVVMLAIAPRRQGFFPDLLSFKKRPAVEQSLLYNEPIDLPATTDSLPADTPPFDSLITR